MTTSLKQFARAIGATVGVTVMGVIVNAEVRNFDDGAIASGHTLPIVRRVELAHAIRLAFLAPLCLCGAVVIVLLLVLRETPLRRDFDDLGPRVAPAIPSG